jgi:transitional endoplasmic reticulum ATPase
MNEFTLPDAPPVRPATPRPSSPENSPSTAFGEPELAQWLASPQAAPWVADWLESLRPILGEALPQLLYKGLGEKADMPRWLQGESPNPLWLRRYLSHSDLADAWFAEGFLQDDPPWLAELLHAERAKVARSFLVTGNIADYGFDPVHGFRPAVRLLVDRLLESKDCVLTFRLSQGLALHHHQDEEDYVRNLLPEEIRNLLGGGEFRSDIPLVAQLCQLFDVLRRWLGGGPPTEGGPGGDAFPRGVALVFENVHLLIPADRSDFERNYLVDNLLHWSNSPELFRSSHCLILLAEALEDVGNELRARGGKIEQLTIPRPDQVSERMKFLMPLLDPGSRMAETRVAQLPLGRSWLQSYGDGTYLERLRRLSQDTAGLTRIGIEDLLQQVAASPGAVLEQADVLALKRERLRQESDGLLEVVDPGIDLSAIGGYEPLKKRLREVITGLRNVADPLVRTTLPKGILFVGPPGTGKTIMAEALARESGISMAKLGDFRGMYVGQSERNLSRILSLIESLHPVIVFIDEMDQAFGKRGGPSGDGGVDRRIFGRLLEFMSESEHRGRILWIGASNFPNEIDSAMKRPGRMDLVLPFLLPDQESRARIFEVILQSKLKGSERVHHRLDRSDFEALGEGTEGFSGAEIGAIVGEVLRRLAHETLQQRATAELTREHFERVLEVYRPAPGVRESYRQMEKLAEREVSFVDLLPDRYRREKGEEDP